MDTPDRKRVVQAFSPRHNGREEWAGTEREIDVLVSTDGLSEGQNRQDCGCLINYDLHWNPTRLVQRAGCIDRLGTDFDYLEQPIGGMQVRKLPPANQAYPRSLELPPLTEACTQMRELHGAEAEPTMVGRSGKEHLRLVCFDMVSG